MINRTKAKFARSIEHIEVEAGAKHSLMQVFTDKDGDGRDDKTNRELTAKEKEQIKSQQAERQLQGTVSQTTSVDRTRDRLIDDANDAKAKKSELLFDYQILQKLTDFASANKDGDGTVDLTKVDPAGDERQYSKFKTKTFGGMDLKKINVETLLGKLTEANKAYATAMQSSIEANKNLLSFEESFNPNSVDYKKAMAELKKAEAELSTGKYHAKAAVTANDPKSVDETEIALFNLINKTGIRENLAAFQVKVAAGDKEAITDAKELEFRLKQQGSMLKADGKVNQETLNAIEGFIGTNMEGITAYEKLTGKVLVPKAPAPVVAEDKSKTEIIKQ